MSFDTDLQIPKLVSIKDKDAAIQAILNICRDSIVTGKVGSNNSPHVKCDVTGLTLGHFYKLWDALGADVCNVIEAVKIQKPDVKPLG